MESQDIFILRDSPKLKIILNEDKFQVINEALAEDNQSYEYVNVHDIHLKEEKMNWLATILHNLVNLFITDWSNDTDGNKFGIIDVDKIIFHYRNAYRQIKIHNANWLKAEQVVQAIKKRKETYT